MNFIWQAMIKHEQEIVAIIGLGYVGFPLAVSLSDHYKVIGFDKDHNNL